MCCEIVVSFGLLLHLNLIFTLPIIEHSKDEEMTNNHDLDVMIQYLNESDNQQNSASTIKRRVKRARGGDKFSQAATMSETKMFQMYLQLFKNMYASSYIGGGHPLHPDVPKPLILMFKQKILSFFFPPVGDEAKKVS